MSMFNYFETFADILMAFMNFIISNILKVEINHNEHQQLAHNNKKQNNGNDFENINLLI